MKIKKITGLATTSICKHIENGAFSTLVESTQKNDNITSVEQFAAILDLLCTFENDLCNQGQYFGYEFVQPDSIIPGKTAHFTCDFYVTVYYLDGSNESLYIYGDVDLDSEESEYEYACELIYQLSEQ